MPLAIVPIIDLLISIICAYCGIRLYKSWQKDHHQLVLKFFAQAYLLLVISYLFFSLPRLIVPNESLYLGIGFVAAQAFLFFALAYFAKITVFFIRVQWTKRIYWLVIFLALFTTFISILFFNYPTFYTESGITDWNIHPLVSAASVFILLGVLGPSAIYFGWQGLKSADQVVKKRSIIISSGIFLLIVTALTYYSASNLTVALISDILSLISFFIIYVGVAYKREIISRIR